MSKKRSPVTPLNVGEQQEVNADKTKVTISAN